MWFSKGLNTQHVFLVMREKMKIASDNRERILRGFLTDLSKAFDRIYDNPLIVKLK